MINFKSIKFQLLTWYAVVLTCFLVCTGAFIYFSFKIYLYKDAKRLVRDKNFAMGGWLDFKKKDYTYQVNEYLSSQESKIFIQLYDLNRNIIATTSNFKDTLHLSSVLAKKVYSIDDVVINEVNNKKYGTLLVASGTTLVNGNINGFINVALPLQETKKTMNAILFWLTAGSSFFLFISIFGGIYLLNKLLSPINHIIAATNKISGTNELSRRLEIENSENELGKLSATLNALLNRLEKFFLAQQQFVSDAAHELRTPFAIIRGEIEVALRSDGNVEELRKILKSNLEEINHLSLLSEDLLILARSDAKQIQINSKIFDLTKTVMKISKKYQVLADEKNIKLTYPFNTLYFSGDEMLIERLLSNLIENAIKYNIDEGEVKINCEIIEDTYLKLSISDTGVGIPEMEIPNIFRRFYRISESRNRNTGGTGLGLAIVESLVKILNGRIEVRSRLGKGTEFVLSIPC